MTNTSSTIASLSQASSATESVLMWYLEAKISHFVNKAKEV